MVGFKEAVRRGFKGTFDMSGRATRAEYWWYSLFHLLWSLPLMIFGEVESFTLEDTVYSPSLITSLVGVLLVGLTLSVFVRRCHDIGLSGWWALPSIVVVVVAFGSHLPGDAGVSVLKLLNNVLFSSFTTLYDLVTLVFCLIPSKKGANQYGPNPHTGDVPSTFD